jgi:hypothetical protein
MSNEEFDLLDELYFVQDYTYLKQTLGWEDTLLLDTLAVLHEQGWIKCLFDPDRECFGEIDIRNQGKDLLYLATKKGLLAHTSL